MSKSVEIEYKNMLSPMEYQQLFDFYQFNEQKPVKQQNYYFDTPDGQLKKMYTGLRLRVTDEYTHLTLKQPLENDAKLETTEKLEAHIAKEIVDTKKISQSELIGPILYNLGVKLEELVLIGSFETHRYETQLKKETLVLDHCFFNHFEDYELELEVSDPTQGKKTFDQLLEEHHIPERQSKQKIVRMTFEEPLYKF